MSDKKNKKTRLNLRVPTGLLSFIKKHAVKNHTTVTALVVFHFNLLKKMEEDAHG